MTKEDKNSCPVKKTADKAATIFSFFSEILSDEDSMENKMG